ncbi:GNAT family N-acyltransferase [Halotia wernerae UHCC 0503]|nr:GNAT family N-acyltransferase [Halotia wernerae UHCC 0503]
MHNSKISIDYSLNSLKDFPIVETENYIIRLALNNEELESIFRLRFQVFNLELGLGYSSSYLTQMDQDEFDAVWHHLILIDKETDKIIGSYRMQTYSMASQALGFYADQYFNLSQINDSLLQVTVEIGRACIAKEYRTIQALSLIFKGLANYLAWSGNQYFLGCASLPTQSHYKACCAYDYFQQNDFMHPDILLYPKSQCSLELPQYCPDSSDVEIPNILQLYLASGAKVCSLPSIDRQFKCIDFLIMFDGANFCRWQ